MWLLSAPRPACAEPWTTAHIKPVSGSGRHADQITAFTPDEKHLGADVQAEQCLTLHEETHLILRMGVLIEKLATQRRTLRVIRSHPDRINRCISAGPLNPLNLIAVSPENAGLIGILIQVLFRRPALEANASPEQLSADLFRVVCTHQLLW